MSILCIITLVTYHFCLIKTIHYVKGEFMLTISNSFALLLLAITMIVFFSIKHHLTLASKYYTLCLISTFFSAIANTLRIAGSTVFSFPTLAMKILGTADLMFITLTMSILALYLVAKVCEHTVDGNLTYAKIAVTIAISLTALVLLLNLKYGFVFESTKSGEYLKGAAYFFPYVFMGAETLVVFLYCIKHLKTLTKSVKIALVESFAVIVLCLLISKLYNNISIFVFAIVLIELLFFLNFQNHRMGVNSLTNLNGSRIFFKEISANISKHKEFRVYLIKLKHLSNLRQHYGHKKGDELLYMFAFHLNKLFNHASAFNLHGATFALIIPRLSDEKSNEERKKLLSFLEDPKLYLSSPMELDYVVSEYVSNGEETGDSIYEQLENAAEIARDSRLKYILCSPELYKIRQRKQYLIDRMQTITSENGFELWFQPIYSVNKKQFSSMEALLRLREPDGSYVSPAEFIPLAEKTGQIMPITWFVIEEACRVLSSNSELKDKRVSINLPMAQLTDSAFDKKLDEIVDRYGLAHNRISFEFTERVIMDDLNIAEKNMKRLARSGYTFYLDDFGTGYSNFNCVLQLPLKTVKLDMSITSTLEAKQDKNNLVNILTDLFHDMGLQVVAEGAETEEQILLLSAFGVDGIQGYYYAKPMPLDKLKEFLQDK